jgi:hypothetical protein
MKERTRGESPVALIQQFTVAEGTTVPFSVAGDREVRITVYDQDGAGTAFGEIQLESQPQGQGFFVQAWTPVGRVEQRIITLNHGVGARYVYTALSGNQLLMVWED